MAVNCCQSTKKKIAVLFKRHEVVMMGNFTPSIWKRTKAGLCQDIPDFYADPFHCQRRVEDA